MSANARIEFMHEGERHVLVYRDSDHSYRIDGRRVPSVSTIAGVSYMNPGALMRWAVNEYKAGRDFEESRDLSAEWGTAAHDQLEALARFGRPLDIKEQPEHVRGCVQAVAKWWIDTSPVFKASEVVVCSPALRVAGRFDFIAQIDGELLLCDLKTSAPTTWEKWRQHKAKKAFAQLAGYACLYRAMWPDNPQPTARCILLVTADGESFFKRDNAPELSEQMFLSKLAAYADEGGWDRAHKAIEKSQQEVLAA